MKKKRKKESPPVSRRGSKPKGNAINRWITAADYLDTAGAGTAAENLFYCFMA